MLNGSEFSRQHHVKKGMQDYMIQRHSLQVSRSSAGARRSMDFIVDLTLSYGQLPYWKHNNKFRPVTKLSFDIISIHSLRHLSAKSRTR